MWIETKFTKKKSTSVPQLEGILPKGLYLPCVSMAGMALLAGYPRIVVYLIGQYYHMFIGKLLDMHERKHITKPLVNWFDGTIFAMNIL